MDNNIFHKTIVKIIAHNVIHDWYAPFRSPYENESIGSGFFFEKNGYILTCCHVVEDAIKLEITIPFEGKQLYPAKVISFSPDYDIAVLKVEYDNEYVLNLIDSDSVNQGDQVNAVGYPLGQDKLKLSQGVISGYQNYHFQTDAPINPGNSGGPLVDSNNNVIAINSQKISSDTADNIGYSVPIKYFNILRNKFMSEIEDNKPILIRYPRLLCKFSKIDELTKQYYNLDVDGYLISEIHENSCLYKSGIKPNDILIQFGDFILDKFGEVKVNWSPEKFNIKDILYRFRVGDKIKVKYYNKNNGFLEIEVTLEYPNFVVDDIYLNLMNVNINYELLAGLVLCDFKRNHLYNHQIGPQTNIKPETKNNLMNYKSNHEKRFEQKILLVNVLPGSHSKSNSDVTSGIFLEEINDLKISSIQELRDIIIENKDFIKLKFSNDQIIILTIELIKQQHQILSKQYNFLKTPLLDILLKGIYPIDYTIEL